MKAHEQAMDDRISASMDDELRGTELSDAVTTLLSREECTSTWLTYHLIGDVLRSEDLAGSARDARFFLDLQERLALEPMPTDPLVTRNLSNSPSRHAPSLSHSSANADVFSWRMVVGLACTVLVVVVGFNGMDSQLPPTTPQTVALTLDQPANPQTSAEPELVGSDGVVRDARLEQFLSAHQQLGGHSALQKPAGFLRNATYERPSR